MDSKDKIIFEHLIHNCRISTTRLAKLTRLSQPSIVYRIKRLEEKGYISKYDMIIDFTKFENLDFNFYLISVPLNKKKQFEEDMKNNKKVVSLFRLINKKNYLIDILENNNLFEKYLMEHNFKYEKFEISDYDIIPFSIYDVKIDKKDLFIQKKSNEKYKLDKIDLKILKYLSEGKGRDSLLEMAQKLKLTYDIISYRFKKLKEHGFFLGAIAQPSEKMFNIQIDLIFIKIKNLDYNQLKQKLSKFKKIPVLIKCRDNTYFSEILSLSFEDYKKTLEALYEILEDNLESLEILTGKDWLFINRFGLEI